MGIRDTARSDKNHGGTSKKIQGTPVLDESAYKKAQISQITKKIITFTLRLQSRHLRRNFEKICSSQSWILWVGKKPSSLRIPMHFVLCILNGEFWHFLQKPFLHIESQNFFKGCHIRFRDPIAAICHVKLYSRCSGTRTSTVGISATVTSIFPSTTGTSK